MIMDCTLKVDEIASNHCQIARNREFFKGMCGFFTRLRHSSTVISKSFRNFREYPAKFNFFVKQTHFKVQTNTFYRKIYVFFVF